MENLSLLVEYHLWAHKRVLQLLPDITDEEWNRPLGGSFPSLRALYQHILEAEYRWLQRWKGVPFAELPQGWAADGYASLEKRLLPLWDEQLAEAGKWLTEDPQKAVHFITGKGLHVTQPFWQTLYQVVNHGTYHRGQVSYMLRMLDRPSVGTDIFLFFNEKNP